MRHILAHRFLLNKLVFLPFEILSFYLCLALLPQNVYAADNPVLPESCGVDIAIIIDNSMSISSVELTQVKSALIGFVNALEGTPTYYSVTRFATNASLIQPFTNDPELVKDAINSVPPNGGYTNWQEAIRTAVGTFDPRPDIPNLILFVTDGNPTLPNCSGTESCQAAVDAAIIETDIAKAYPIRILAVGIGDDLNKSNLQAISGPTVDDAELIKTDVIIAKFIDFAEKLKVFANQMCGGTIIINKYIDEISESARGGQGWKFEIGSNEYITGNNGRTEAVKVGSGDDHTVTETGLEFGYEYGSSSCKDTKTNQTVGSAIANGVGGIKINFNDLISCDFVNKTSCAAAGNCACNWSVCTGGNQCASGHCFEGYCRNLSCEKETDCACPAWWQVNKGNVFSNYAEGITAAIKSIVPKLQSLFRSGGSAVWKSGGIDYNKPDGDLGSLAVAMQSGSYDGKVYDFAYWENKLADYIAVPPFGAISGNTLNLAAINEDGIYLVEPDIVDPAFGLSINASAAISKQIAILYKGPITIASNITTDHTASPIIIIIAGGSKGSININPVVVRIYGYYIADDYILTGSKGVASDKQLFINGGLISWRGVNLQRDLEDNTQPGELFDQNFKMINDLKTTTSPLKAFRIYQYSWQELEP